MLPAVPPSTYRHNKTIGVIADEFEGAVAQVRKFHSDGIIISCVKAIGLVMLMEEEGTNHGN